MGNNKSKKVQKKEPEKFFERERWKEKRMEEIRKRQKRFSFKDGPVPPPPPSEPSAQHRDACAHPAGRLCDDEGLNRMRYQLNNDAEAFLLNNILLSVQFFENYERELSQQRDNPTSDVEHDIEEELVHHHKHVFYGDRLLDVVHDHVQVCGRKSQHEPIAPSRLFVVYDNVEAAEPGDMSDYSAVLDVPFYKLVIEDSKEAGYVKLKMIEILGSSARRTSDVRSENKMQIYGTHSESENESCEAMYEKQDMPSKDRINNVSKKNCSSPKEGIGEGVRKFLTERKNISALKENKDVERNNISKYNGITTKDLNNIMPEGLNDNFININNHKNAGRKSLPRNENKQTMSSNHLQENSIDIKENIQTDDTETSGYRSNASSRLNELTETESEYGYATITESATPKPLELSLQANFSMRSGVLPDECFMAQKEQALNEFSEDDDDTLSLSQVSKQKNLYNVINYLGSESFMTNFIDNFMIKLGTSLALSQDTVNNALTQGASIYCQSRHSLRSGYEIVPVIVTAWPSFANQWIIRQRRIVQNPRNNMSYQWPTKYMVSKATTYGCMLQPLGFRPKRGMNPDQRLQWKIIFPAAERYLESCLAHSHVRCYLFALVLQRCFMQSEKNKIGLDPSHIKHHLFRQCEHNFTKWPEDRLGESLRIFLRSFYTSLAHGKFPNYFIEDCNDFKSIPKPQLLKIQKKLADILEAPVMHILYALRKLWYVPKEFYPTFNIMRLYEILTCRNPVRLLHPNLKNFMSNEFNSTDSEEEDTKSIWQQDKIHDRHYQWKKERQRQMQHKRKTQYQSKNQTNSKREIINPKIIIPKRLESERKRLVLEFFIPHFMAMSRMSERFDAIKQAVIYLEQAQRLCMLLQEESYGEASAIDYLVAISENLHDCRQKLISQSRIRLRRQKEKHQDFEQVSGFQKQRPKYMQMISSESSVEAMGLSHSTLADIHHEVHVKSNPDLALVGCDMGSEKSKL